MLTYSASCQCHGKFALSQCQVSGKRRGQLRDVRTRHSGSAAAVEVFEKNAEAAMMDDSLKPVRGESIEDEPVSEEAKLPKAPEWTKLAAIFVTSGIFALIEWFICERLPTIWAPSFFLVSFVVWRLSLRDTQNSNVPARSPDRLFILAVCGLIFLWEYTVRSVIVWAPWVSLLVAVLLAPSSREMTLREAFLTDEVLVRSQREFQNRIPVTPKESAAWVGRLLGCFWTSFVEPMLLKTAIVPLQEQVEAVAPQGWLLSLDGFSLGDVAPILSGWQVYNDAQTGKVESLTAELLFDSTSLQVSLTGNGPLVGKFVVNLRGIKLRGSMRFVPFSSERLLLFSFVQKPELDVKLNIRGRFIGQQSIPQFDFLREAVIAVLQQDYVVPNYGMFPLEFSPTAGEALSSRLTIKVIRVLGLSQSDKAVPTSWLNKLNLQKDDEHQGGVAIEINSPEEERVDKNAEQNLPNKMLESVLDQLPASQARKVKVSIAIEEVNIRRELLPRPVNTAGDAMVNQVTELQLSTVRSALDIKVSNEKGFRIGVARARLEHCPDGATAFWGSTTGGKPVAKRWIPGSAPWKVQLILEGTESALVEVELKVAPWQYSLDSSPLRRFRKTLRSVVAIQVLEARALAATDYSGSSDPYVLVSYNKRAASTRTVHQSLNPIFGDVLLFQENRSILARRVRFDVYDRDRGKAEGDGLGYGYVNLDMVAEGQVLEQWVQLRNSITGEVRVRLLVLSGTDESLEVREAAMNALDAAQVVYTSDSFKLTVEKVEGLPSKCSGKLMLAEVTYQGAMQATGKKAAKDRNVEWSEDLRFRVDESEHDPLARISVRISSGGGLGTGGREIGFVTVDTKIVTREIQRLRQKERAEKGKDSLEQSGLPKVRGFSAASLKTGNLKREENSTLMKRNKKAEKVKVAQSQDGVRARRTDIVEVWLPLQNAGSDARVLIKLQGAVGEADRLTLNPLQQTAILTDEVVDVEAAKTGFAAAIEKLQALGRNVASAIFD